MLIAKLALANLILNALLVKLDIFSIMVLKNKKI
jgi:hypothetical protein